MISSYLPATLLYIVFSLFFSTPLMKAMCDYEGDVKKESVHGCFLRTTHGHRWGVWKVVVVAGVTKEKRVAGETREL